MSEQDEVTKAFEREFANLPHVFPASCSEPDENGSDCWQCEACDQRAEFSSSRCEVCGALPGAREPLVAFRNVGPDMTEDDGPFFYSVCGDCYYFAAYGEVLED